MAHKFHSEWCAYLQWLITRKGLNQSTFAEQAGLQQQMVHVYLQGRSKPPLNQLHKWVEVLGLEGEERETFLWLANETYTPPVVWDRVKALEKSLATSEAELVKLRAQLSEFTLRLADAKR
jgi:transcriptional regulator with XRE-family HTH domain